MNELRLQQVSDEQLGINSVIEGTETERDNSLDILNGLEQAGIPVEDKEGVASSLDVLRQEFELDDAVFSSFKNKVTIGAIADRLNRTEKDESLDFGQKSSEREYVADMVMSAFGSHTKFRDYYKSTQEKKGFSTEHTKKVYDKFTHPEVTRDMDAFIRGSAFDDLRNRLGVEEEDPYEVRVLSIASYDGLQAHGLFPYAEYKDNSSWAEYEEVSKENDLRKDYVEGLYENAVLFNQEVGRDTHIGPAWVATFDDGTQYLCLALPTAEKVLYKDEERAKYYDEDDWQRDLAAAEHEYTHTQKMLLFDHNIGLGIALEELRAEHFSGDKAGYTDIKKFVLGVNMLTGYSPKKSFEREGTPYDEEAFLTEIAAKLGLDGLLDMLTAIPANYVADEHVSPFTKAIVEHNGGSLSSHFEKFYQKTRSALGEETVSANISAAVDRVRETLKDKGLGVEAWFAYGGITSFARLGIDNFRSRYPDESDNYDYFNRES